MYKEIIVEIKLSFVQKHKYVSIHSNTKTSKIVFILSLCTARPKTIYDINENEMENNELSSFLYNKI